MLPRFREITPHHIEVIPTPSTFDRFMEEIRRPIPRPVDCPAIHATTVTGNRFTLRIDPRTCAGTR